MPDAPQIDRRERLLVHLDSVYTLAQALTPEANQAVQLVEDTYTQALATLPLGSKQEDDKRWLLHLLLHVYQERTAFANPAPGQATPADETLGAFRRRLAEELAESALPAVFATLPEEQRLILLLCEMEALSCADAALVLDLEADDACRRLEQARAAVEAALRADASGRERSLLETSLPEGWLGEALHRTAATAFRPAPPSLRPAIVTATEARLPPAPPPDLPAPTDLPPPVERPVILPPRPRAFGVRVRRLVVSLVLVLTVGLAGYLASRSLERPPETNLITLFVQQADDLSLTFRTGNPAQAEEFVRGSLGRRLTLPGIDGAVLTGVGTRNPAPGVSVPVFLYEDTLLDDPAARPMVLYVYSYALLDRYSDRLQLEPGILRQIQEEQRFDLHDLGERQVLVWRNRDDIYVAITSGAAEALRGRIVFPS